MQTNLIDKSFKPENASQYELSVQIDKDLLAYCVFDPERKQYLVFRSYSFKDVHLMEELMNQMAETFLKDEFMDLAFKKTRLIYYSQLSTLVPDQYFDDKYDRDYYGFNHSLEPGNEVFNNFIPTIGAWNVFSVPSPIVSILNNQFREGILMHQATPFLLPRVIRQGTKEDLFMYIGINRDFFDVAAFQGNKLLLYNTFPYVNETDLLYYVLYVLREMALEPNVAPLFLSGEMSTRLLYYDTLKQYIPGITYANAPDTFAFAPALYNVSVHKFLNLLTVHNCVSSVENTREGEFL